MTDELNKNILIESFAKGRKKKENWRIGTEHEKFGFKKKSLEPIIFEDIEKIFHQLSVK